MEDSLGISKFMRYMNSLETVFLGEAIKKVDEGLLKYPNRLDLIFGKLFAIRYHQQWTWFTKEVLKVIKLSKLNDNKWLWEGDKTISQDEFLCTLEEHINFLATHSNDSLQFEVIKIAEVLLEQYPNRHKAKFDLSIAYLLTDNLDLGIKSLHELEKVFPNNLDITYNLAKAYKNNNQPQKAIEYFTKLKGFDDKSAKKYAKKQLKIFKKQY